MTERANRAAAVLAGLGWALDETYGKQCLTCRSDMPTGSFYCAKCGTKAVASPSRSTLDDLEQAISAANQEPT